MRSLAPYISSNIVQFDRPGGEKTGTLEASIPQFVESQGRGFEFHQGRGVVSLSKKLHPHCLVLVKPKKPPQND